MILLLASSKGHLKCNSYWKVMRGQCGRCITVNVTCNMCHGAVNENQAQHRECIFADDAARLHICLVACRFLCWWRFVQGARHKHPMVSAELCKEVSVRTFHLVYSLLSETMLSQYRLFPALLFPSRALKSPNIAEKQSTRTCCLCLSRPS